MRLKRSPGLKRVIFWFSVLLSGVALGWAWTLPLDTTRLTAESAECACDPAVADALEEPRRLEFGKYKGECVDMCRFRRSRVKESKDGHLTVTNIRHEGKYWTGDLPAGRVEWVDVGFENFMPRISHVYLRFHFSRANPVILTEQGAGKTGRAKTFDIVVSPEAAPTKDRHFSLTDGALKNYLLSYRIVSLEEIYDWAIVKQNHSINQYRLKLSAPQAWTALRDGLFVGDAKSLNSVYSLFNNNCATSVIDVVDMNAIPNLSQAFPVDLFFGTLTEMKARGLIDTSLERPTLQAEMKN